MQRLAEGVICKIYALFLPNLLPFFSAHFSTFEINIRAPYMLHGALVLISKRAPILTAIGADFDDSRQKFRGPKKSQNFKLILEKKFKNEKLYFCK